MNVLDFVVKDQKGNEVSLKQYAGKVLIIVNTATHCGFTPQYDALEALYEKYHEQGLEILDFPCNQFFRQAPESDEEINHICQMRFNTKFPRFKKIDVKGANADPLFVALCTDEKGKVKAVKWNFTKFLISKEGELIGRFEPKTKPEEMEDEIIEALKK